MFDFIGKIFDLILDSISEIFDFIGEIFHRIRYRTIRNV